jgi:class 3 adenylate cyclase/predicted ATPase
MCVGGISGVIMDLGGWLRSLGLERYEAAFRENEIDEAVLPSLTPEDLKELGVSAVGHRRKLLDAIAALRADTDAASVVSLSPAAVDASPRDTAERRQTTVMFSDLVGSTALSARMDPEDLREIISAYQKCVAETVHRFDGFVAKYMGDGVLVYFGYPQAHEDDPERAVRAGLELIAAIGGLDTRTSLQTRVGIATGLVVVGDLIGSGEAQERGIIGGTPNLAARLQGIAEPNTVVIADDTRKLLGSLFELNDLGPRELKGIAAPVRTWRVLRPSSVESRFEALHAGRLTALVGREDEAELLVRRWSRAKSGEGQVVLISGEAGIGKSRLTAELLESVADEPHTRLRYFCSPQHTDSALYPFIGQIERAAGLAHDDAPLAKLNKLDALLARTSASQEDAGLITELLSLPNDGRYPALDLRPEQRRQRTLEVLIAQIDARTRQNPVLIIFEDAHWSDPTSLEVFGQVVDHIRNLRVLLIVTFRTDFAPPWSGRAHVTALTISRLAGNDVDALIDRLVGNRQLAANIRHEIVDRTDGIPLFIEEMTRAVLEAENQSTALQLAATVPSAARAIPATLHASLIARLDRLGRAKEIAQVGSAIGREFSHALLAAVVRQPAAKLASALERLIAAGLLFRQGVPPHASYLFKHALVQEAAYSTLLRETKRKLHTRIAESLEGQFAEIAEAQPELVAQHCSEAGLFEKAVRLWGKAAQRSIARSALVEAMAQLTRALDQIAALPTNSSLRSEQINLQVALLTPLIHVKGYAAPETKAATERARRLIEQAEALGELPEDPLLWFSALYTFWTVNVVAFNADVVRNLAAEFLALAEKQNAKAAQMIGHRMMGNALLLSGDIAEAPEHYDQAIALYDLAEGHLLTTRFGVDTWVAVLVYRSLALWILGYPERALADVEHALKKAREIGQAATLMYTLAISALTLMHSGSYATASRQSDELVALADEKGAALWKAVGITNQGCTLALTSKASNAVKMITSGITALRSTGTTLFVPLYLSDLAHGQAELGNFDSAWRCIGEAMTAAQTTEERWGEAEIYRTAGEIALLSAGPDAAKAEAFFERALAVARAQKAKSWELRAAMSLAQLWRDNGKGRQARDLLAAVYGWFTEGFDTLDLKEAKALLGELHS